ncbi:hypothetical protein ACH5AL_15275 [Actinacidiphila glaucinigra]|uniref:hypothetical protein n=1 Tax=Actinacidiphila glaucinigra TaxID=235986 RepID=UPI003793D7FB
MTADWYMAYGGVEVANHARLGVYLQTVGSPLTSAGACGCPTVGAEQLGDLPYTTPDDADSPAPWYDPDVPESTDFAGIMVLEMSGIDDFPVRRNVTGGIIGGGSIGPARALPRTITVTALVLGATCCGVEYGLHWLGEVLQGCTGSACDGDCLTLYSCCPGEEDLTPEQFNAEHRRTLRRVALVDGPNVVARSGTGCATGDCQSGADIITVEFVLTAAMPWLWTDTTPVLEVAPPGDDSTDCIDWCVHAPDGPGCDGPCRFAPCPDPTAACADPRCAPPPPPTPTLPSETCYCLPVAVERECYDLDLTDRPAWSTDAPMITVRAGSSDLRNLTLEIFERAAGDEALTPGEVADLYRCTPYSAFHVTYVPAGGALTLDGQVGRATVECGGVCESSPDVYGREGLPPTWRTLGCASYVICLTSDVSNPPSPSAMVSVGVSGRGR